MAEEAGPGAHRPDDRPRRACAARNPGGLGQGPVRADRRRWCGATSGRPLEGANRSGCWPVGIS